MTPEMANHPNRGPRGPSANHTAADLAALLARHGLSAARAAALAHRTTRSIELMLSTGANRRRVDPAIFELIDLKARANEHSI